MVAALFVSVRAHADEVPTETAGFRPASHWVGVTPTWTHVFGSGSASHEALGLALETFVGRRWGIGLASAWYAPFSGEPPVGPARETFGSIFTEARFTLARGERAELAVTGGSGVLATRPRSRVDPARRSFDYQTKLMAAAGAVGRVFLMPDVALSLEGRHLAWIDTKENERVSIAAPEDPATWFGDKLLVHAFEARVGITMFFGAK